MSPEHSGGGILAGPIDGPARTAAQYPHRAAEPGIRVLHRASGFTGTLVALEGDDVVLRGHTGLERRYQNVPGTFAVEGTPTHLVSPRRARRRRAARSPKDVRTASGSRAVDGRAGPGRRAPAASGWRASTTPNSSSGCGATISASRASWSNGSTVPTTWPPRCARSAPRATAASACCSTTSCPGARKPGWRRAIDDPHVLVTGTPFVDVWEAVRPAAVGIRAWPVVPKGQNWKDGVCAALGVDDPRTMWRRILAAVSDWKQLEQPFVAAVEQLIDFVTE